MATETRSTEPGGALLVIHGIGEQRPYEALDSFVRGVARRCGIEEGDLDHRLIWRAGHADSAVRVPLVSFKDRIGAPWLDVYEYYWAAEVERRISFRKVLVWVGRTSLTPLRTWATNPDLLRQEDKSPRALFFRELRRAVCLIGLAAIILGLFVWVGTNEAELFDLVARAWQALMHPLPRLPVTRGQTWLEWLSGLPGRLVHNEFPLVLFAWSVLVLLGGALLRSLTLLRSAPREQAAMKERAFGPWRSRTLAFGLLFLAVAALLALIPPLGIGAALWGSLSIFFCNRLAGALLLATLLAGLVRWFLVKYVGDVALYVDEDERSASFATREEVLGGAVARLHGLLSDPAYRSVHVAGHSLGSVIAYDAVDYLAREMRAEPVGGQADTRLSREQFDKLAGLLTFGSPLDKVLYFFRTQVEAKQAVRAQLLSSLHSFRKRSSGRDYGPLHFAVYDPPEPRRLLWLNVYSPGDPVSGRLDFYRTDHQEPMGYRLGLWSHMRYWEDPRFYEWVALWLSAPDAAGLKQGPS